MQNASYLHTRQQNVGLTLLVVSRHVFHLPSDSLFEAASRLDAVHTPAEPGTSCQSGLRPDLQSCDIHYFVSSAESKGHKRVTDVLLCKAGRSICESSSSESLADNHSLV